MPRFTLVLGAGGTVGMAHHAGVLRALHEHGFDAADADVIVGTSAGAVMGAAVRSGHSVEDLWDQSQTRGVDDDDDPQVILPGWRTGLGLARRTVGSGFVLLRTATRWPPMYVPAPLARWWRGGLAATGMMRSELAEWIGEDWPERPLWLVTVDLTSGRRIVLGRDDPGTLTLAEGVRASSAVPGLFPPVRHGQRVLVDGGAHSVTNADLAGSGPDRAGTVVVVTPMGFDRDARPDLAQQAIRSTAVRNLRSEVKRLRRRGHDVITLVPSSEEIAAHGFDMIRRGDHSEIARLAHAGASRELAAQLTKRLLSSA